MEIFFGTLFVLLLVTAPIFYIAGWFVIAKKWGRFFMPTEFKKTPTLIHKSVPQTASPKIKTPTKEVHHDQPAALAALGWSLWVVLITGLNTFPYGLQIPFLVFGWVVSMIWLGGQRRARQQLLLMVSLSALAFWSVITSNPLLDIINRVIIVLLSWWWLLLTNSGQWPSTFSEVMVASGRQLGAIIESIFRERPWPNVFRGLSWPSLGAPKRPSVGAISSQAVLAFSLGLVLLIFFNAMFVRINAEYALFVETIWDSIWKVLVFIWELDIVVVAVKTLLLAVPAYWFMAARFQPAVEKEISHTTEFLVWETILWFCTGIFGVFSFFQTKLIANGVTGLAFKELSLYVIQGFWELVLVAIVGYIISWLTLQVMPVKFPSFKLKKMAWLLSLYIFELLLIAYFGLHKLFLHQTLFGFKDQRILATAGVAILAVTFLLLLARVWRRQFFPAARVWQWQVITVVSVVVALNLLNLDMVATRWHRIRYYVQEQPVSDYAYLLGNSYDNVAAWPELINEALTVPVLRPETEYYYGWYPSLCQANILGPSTLRQELRRGDTSFLIAKLRYLETKYASDKKRSLPELLQFHWREYEAFLFWQSHQTEFTQVVARWCS